jgi:hypothetical protein
MNNNEEHENTQTINQSIHKKPEAPRKFQQVRRANEKPLANEYLLLAKRTASNTNFIKNHYLSKHKLLEATIDMAFINKENSKRSKLRKSEKSKNRIINDNSGQAGHLNKPDSKRRILLEDFINKEANEDKETLCVDLEENKQKSIKKYYKFCKNTPKAEKARKSNELDNDEYNKSYSVRRKLK